MINVGKEDERRERQKGKCEAETEEKGGQGLMRVKKRDRKVRMT